MPPFFLFRSCVCVCVLLCHIDTHKSNPCFLSQHMSDKGSTADHEIRRSKKRMMMVKKEIESWVSCSNQRTHHHHDDDDDKDADGEMTKKRLRRQRIQELSLNVHTHMCAFFECAGERKTTALFFHLTTQTEEQGKKRRKHPANKRERNRMNDSLEGMRRKKKSRMSPSDGRNDAAAATIIITTTNCHRSSSSRQELVKHRPKITRCQSNASQGLPLDTKTRWIRKGDLALRMETNFPDGDARYKNHGFVFLSHHIVVDNRQQPVDCHPENRQRIKIFPTWC